MTQPWPNNYIEQKSYINELEQRLEILNRKSIPATVIGTTKPGNSEMALAWSLKKGKTINIPPESKTQWYNPETQRVENVFLQLPSLSPNPLGLQVDKNSLANCELISDFYVSDGDTLVSSYTASWAKVYKAIVFFWSLRSTTAATSALVRVRPNSDTGSNYSHAASYINQTPTATFNTTYLGANGWSFITVPGATAGNSYIFGQGSGIIYFPANTSQAKSGFFDSINLADAAAGATDFQYLTGGMHWNNLSAMTSIAFIPAGNFAVGSRIIVLGLHPET